MAVLSLKSNFKQAEVSLDRHSEDPHATLSAFIMSMVTSTLGLKTCFRPGIVGKKISPNYGRLISLYIETVV